MDFHVFPIPEPLREYVECIRTSEYDGKDRFAINVCLNGLPGLVFQHHNGHSPIENIVTRSSSTPAIPTLYVYGQMTEPGIMNHKPEPFTTTQVVLKPHALQALLGVNATVVTNACVELREFSAAQLNMRLFEAKNEQERVALLLGFLGAKLWQARTADRLVEESLRIIHKNTTSITVNHLLERLSISERQFEKRFIQTVGIPPQFYIRIKRFNQAIRLIQTRQFEKLTDVAHSLNFYDQSHFIRDVKAFSGTTPKTLAQKMTNAELDQGVLAYI
ncbi:MAG: AraC family transcriptional regulator [Chloroflexota bacterium]